ncbi:MAG: RnfABCDGE type electron transport complex subunit G [Treponema sp.]|nr:RnfABCDGE type electron transport complex subunit G [Treponema sp.]
MKYILKPAFFLFFTAVIVVAFLSVVYALTKDPIERQKERTREVVKKAVFPNASDFKEISINKTGSINAVFECYEGNNMIGYIVELSPKGYSDNIDIMVGIALPDEKISGMRVMRHSETPGLGALAVKEEFYRRYDNLPLKPLVVVRSSPGENEIQAITSATITTRAITNAVNEAIEWVKRRIE